MREEISGVIPRMSLRTMLYHREFLQRLYQLGTSAREQRESNFQLIIDPDNKHLHFPPTSQGGITFVYPQPLERKSDQREPDDTENIKTVYMNVHSHPSCLRPGRTDPNEDFGRWKVFFPSKIYVALSLPVK